jgi:hypothetical protein
MTESKEPTLFITHISDEKIIIQGRAEGDGMIGDAMWKVQPGQPFAGYSFDELKALGRGGILPKKED